MISAAKTFGGGMIPLGSRKTDLICIGRGIADLYADQLGGRLEDAVSFSAYVGGSAVNICVGVARLGLNSSMVLRLGDDHMGRLVRETLERNAVDTQGVLVDSVAPTPLCILGVRDRGTFPRDLFTNGGAYLNLTEGDLNPEMFHNARAVLINGSFFATESLRAVCRRALKLAAEAGCATALDIDYRPALWGLVGHGFGDAAFVESAAVTKSFAEFLPMFDLIVGTEEEIAIAGGATDDLEAVRRIRSVSDATVVLKRGPAGCIAFDGPIPDDLEQGTMVSGFRVEVMNTAGAGDSFMAGFVSGWLTDQTLEQSCRVGNACGAINVSRHGCSDSAPSHEEIKEFIAEGVEHPENSLRMRQLHALLGRQSKQSPKSLMILSSQDMEGTVAQALAAAKAGKIDGVLCPPTDRFGELADLTGQGIWIARGLVVEPTLRGGIKAVSDLRRWPREHILWSTASSPQYVDEISALAIAVDETRHEILVDVSAAPDPDETIRAILTAGILPEWWLLAVPSEAAEQMLNALPIPPRGVLNKAMIRRD